MSPDPRKVQVPTDMLPPKYKKELQLFLGILNYLCGFSSITVEVCEPLQKWTSIKADWTWNKMYKDLYERTKKTVKKDACMRFYDVAVPFT